MRDGLLSGLGIDQREHVGAFDLEFLAARAHAQWDIETSTNVVKNRKKLLILLVLALLPFVNDLYS